MPKQEVAGRFLFFFEDLILSRSIIPRRWVAIVRLYIIQCIMHHIFLRCLYRFLHNRVSAFFGLLLINVFDSKTFLLKQKTQFHLNYLSFLSSFASLRFCYQEFLWIRLISILFNFWLKRPSFQGKPIPAVNSVFSIFGILISFSKILQIEHPLSIQPANFGQCPNV